VQSAIPTRGRHDTKQTGLQKAVAALGNTTGSEGAHTPSTKGMLGILAGGVGAAAVATRRYAAGRRERSEKATAPPVHTNDSTSPAGSGTSE